MEKHLIFRTERELFHADTCEPLKEAAGSKTCAARHTKASTSKTRRMPIKHAKHTKTEADGKAARPFRPPDPCNGMAWQSGVLLQTEDLILFLLLRRLFLRGLAFAKTRHAAWEDFLGWAGEQGK